MGKKKREQTEISVKEDLPPTPDNDSHREDFTETSKKRPFADYVRETVEALRGTGTPINFKNTRDYIARTFPDLVIKDATLRTSLRLVRLADQDLDIEPATFDAGTLRDLIRMCNEKGGLREVATKINEVGPIIDRAGGYQQLTGILAMLLEARA